MHVSYHHVITAASRDGTGCDVKDSDDHDARSTGDDALLQDASLVLQGLDVTDFITLHVCRHVYCTHTSNSTKLSHIRYCMKSPLHTLWLH